MRRNFFLKKIEDAFRTHSIVAILGPRQCGKTTLSKQYVNGGSAHFFDLEDPADIEVLKNPKIALDAIDGLVVLDEIQRLPDIFPVLRVLVDGDKNRRFLILGSASRDLIRQSSETLAGRIAYIELNPFSLFEVENSKKLWLRGGFPRSYLAKSSEDSFFWRKQYVTTFLERDIPNLGIGISPNSLRRFWMMLTHYHGQIFNASQIGKALGIADTTLREYLSILAGIFMVRELLPWFANIKKREIKRPKIYFRDSGIYHLLSNIENEDGLFHNPKLGDSWEGFALEEVIRANEMDASECFFWGIHGQAEIDLFFIKNAKRRGFEFKYSDAPSLTSSMQKAVNMLGLDSLYVIYPGGKDYMLADKIYVKGLSSLEAF